MQDSTVKFVIGMIGLSYEGKLGPAGDTITGTWTQGGKTPFTFRKATKETTWTLPSDPTPHEVRFVTVEPGVKLEVLDWGGSGRPLIFLAGLGDTAHVYDPFAPKFTSKYHVYDPGYSALYTPGLGDTQLGMINVRNKIEQLLPYDPGGPKQPTEALLVTLSQLEKDLQSELKMKQEILPPGISSAPPPPHESVPLNAAFAIFNEEQKLTGITAPCLAIFAVPHDRGVPTDPAHQAAAAAFELKRSTDMANAFATGVPSAKVIRLPHANHYVFRSNEAVVFQAMSKFLDTLPEP